MKNVAYLNTLDVIIIITLFSVIPAKPYNLTLINKTSESALLYWELPFPMATFPVGVHHRIMYQHQWDHEKDWKVRPYTNGIFLFR